LKKRRADTMPRTELVERFLNPSTPKRVRLSAARGAAPLPSGDLIDLLVSLTTDAEEEIAGAAKGTLSGFSEDDFVQEAGSEACRAEVLGWLASNSSFAKVLEAVVQNANTPPAAIERLAAGAGGQLQESILDNKVRIIEHPEILASLKKNPALTPQASRLAHEIESEFFAGKSTAYEIEAPAAESPTSADSIPEATLPDLTSLEGLPLDPEERESALLEKLAKMTVPQKLKQAMFGPREVRAILIRDNNREVAKSVLHSPKLTESEVESFAAMRNVAEDVLREIGNSRELTRSYTVAHSLVKNPKTPSMIAQRLLSRLHTRDLALIGRDRGVPEAVRRNAQRIASQRESGRQGG
jgi:hypothetical protein